MFEWIKRLKASLKHRKEIKNLKCYWLSFITRTYSSEPVSMLGEDPIDALGNLNKAAVLEEAKNERDALMGLIDSLPKGNSQVKMIAREVKWRGLRTNFNDIIGESSHYINVEKTEITDENGTTKPHCTFKIL